MTGKLFAVNIYILLAECEVFITLKDIKLGKANFKKEIILYHCISS